MAKVSLRAYNREIETMIDRGQLDEAVAHCHHILKTYPKHLETYRLLGKTYLETKRYGDAADIFLRILASVPNDFVAQVGMSIIRDEENKLDDAIWHMERAFETQPSNPAIQSELQRLYARRDGVQPPRIRMTRGALAHMYVQGELYPQAISEIKSVLKDDAGRSDMQTLLARATFKSGQKNEAADVASAVLRRYPYSLDANRVLAEILGAERPENAQIYRQRVIELDPYAAQVAGSIFLSNEAPEAAVTVERLDWNGQPVSVQPDWGETRGITLESDASRNEQPDWLKNQFGQTMPPAPSQPTPASIFDTPAPSQPAPAQPADEIPDFLKAAGWGQSTGAFDESKSAFAEESSTSGVEPLAQGDLPDWVKAMKPAEPEAATPTAEEELPDWITNIGKGALSSQPGEQPAAPQSSEETDWMSQLQETPSAPAADDMPAWMKQTDETPAAPAEEQPDWLKGLANEPEPTTSSAQSEELDWLKGLGSEAPEPSAAVPSDEQDWLKGLGSESDFTPQPAQTETPDWLKNLDNEPAPAPAQEADDMAWLKGLGLESEPEAETPAPQAASTDFDFLNQLTEEPVLQTPEPAAPAANVENLGVSEQEQDDSFAWLESLAAKQGATEGLLTKPEERLEEEPEWVKQAKGLSTPQPPAAVAPPVTPPPAKVEELGRNEQEQDDAFAWLENLAAKQGATEGLLTKPEERLQEEPEWIKQAKGLGVLGSSQPATPETPALEPEPAPQQPQPSTDEVEEWLTNLERQKPAEPAKMDETAVWLKNLEAQEPASEPEPEPAQPTASPSASVEDLGKREQEQDDAFAWLESLAAKQGATEGLLTKPEERLEQEPEWVRQAKDLDAQQPPVAVTPESQPATPEPQPEPESQQPAAVDDTAAWLQSLEEAEKPVELVAQADETETWLKSLEEEKTPEPASGLDQTLDWLRDVDEEKPADRVPAADETAMWLKDLEKGEAEPAQPVESTDVDLPAWMKNLEEEEAPSKEALEEAPRQPAAEEPVATTESKFEAESIPNWLADLDKEEEKLVPASADDDLPAWLRAEEAAPAAAEPTQPSDWKPVEAKEPEIVYSPPLEETKPPEIVYSPPLEETREPEPVAPVSFEKPQEQVVEQAEEKVVEPPQEEPKPESVRKAPVKPTPQPEPYKEPITRTRGTGMLVMPGIDPMLGMARNELSRSNIPGALESYGKLIKKGRYLDEVIYDLRDALYRYPVEVSIWQSLGDAYMRANRLQDALDAYTKAEELLR